MGRSARPARLRGAGQIAPGVPALPRLADGQGTAAVINEALRQGDEAVGAALAACLRGNTDAPGPPAYWKREIRVTLRGVRYLGIVETDDTYCGGAHGARWTKPWVFDLRTGSLVDWRRVLPPGWAAETREEQAWQGIEVNTVLSGPLREAYRRRYALALNRLPASVRAGCRNAISEAGAFVLWPTARDDGLAVQAAGLPSAVSVCALAVTIGVPALRGLGADPELVGDIEAAHARTKAVRPTP